jgi:hypothetical protein
MKLDIEVNYNEDTFLNEVYSTVKRKNSTSLASKIRTAAKEKSMEDIYKSEFFNIPSPIEK